VAANLAADPPAGVRTIAVQTAAELLTVCRQEFPAADVLLMAAAVADFRPARPAEVKLKKDRGMPEAIELAETDDVLATLSAERRAGQVLVGFAAEHGDRAVEYGRRKLEGKGLDAVVVNDISRADIGFDSSQNEVVIITAGHQRRVPRAVKELVAGQVLDEVDRIWLRERKEGSGGGVAADASRGARA
jgi:phosphopantothenoylcysteine decarboxylase/phosphopantothenate--cysteine ligase